MQTWPQVVNHFSAFVTYYYFLHCAQLVSISTCAVYPLFSLHAFSAFFFLCVSVILTLWMQGVIQSSWAPAKTNNFPTAWKKRSVSRREKEEGGGVQRERVREVGSKGFWRKGTKWAEVDKTSFSIVFLSFMWLKQVSKISCQPWINNLVVSPCSPLSLLISLSTYSLCLFWAFLS